jgi:hypothetical protein
MSLKSLIADDINAVFFDEDDFAEAAIINGQKIPIIKDDDFLAAKTETYAIGLSEGEQVIFVRAKDFKNGLPQVSQELEKDGIKWYIRHAINNMGVYELRIGRSKNG